MGAGRAATVQAPFGAQQSQINDPSARDAQTEASPMPPTGKPDEPNSESTGCCEAWMFATVRILQA